MPVERDVATVTKDGRQLAREIEGVRVRTTINHLDHRGSVFEIFEGPNEFWTEPVVYAYQSSILPGQIKGWAVHERKVDRYTIITGEILIHLWDDREDSPTRGVIQRVVLSDRGARMLMIPVGVWHLLINLGDDEARLVNFPTEPYHHDRPDRLLMAWDAPESPINVADVLPKF